MKFQHLKFFCAVVETRSVTLASQQLHISQPAISAGLKALQDDLGLRLFERSGGRHRIIPTPAALRFYADAKDILARCEAARAKVAAPSPRPEVLRLGILRTLACGDVAAVLGDLLRSSGPIWEVREGSAAEISKWLAQSRIDIAWTTVERLGPTAEILWREPFDVLVARHHRLASSPSGTVHLADLSGEPFILRASCELKSGRLKASGIKLRVVARAGRDDLAMKLVAQGLGAAIAPRSFATEKTVALPFADADLARDIGLRWRAGLSGAQVARIKDAVTRLGYSRQGT